MKCNAIKQYHTIPYYTQEREKESSWWAACGHGQGAMQLLAMHLHRAREREKERARREKELVRSTRFPLIIHLKNIISNADADGTWRVYLEGHKWKERVRKEQKKISYTYMFTQVHVYILEQHS